MKIFISQPMSGLDEEEVMATRRIIESELTLRGHEYPPTTYYENIPDHLKDNRIYLLGKALERLAECDAIFMAPQWGSSIGCCIEYEVANQYGLQIYFTVGFIPDKNGNYIRYSDSDLIWHYIKHNAESCNIILNNFKGDQQTS